MTNETKVITANDAIILTAIAHEKNAINVYDHIQNVASQGLRTTVLFQGLSDATISKLMNEGYSIGYATDQLGLKQIKISW